jgi:hypothetical protein
MSSNQLRKLNSYPEWKSKKDIDEVKAFVLSIQNDEEPKYPASLSTRDKRRYMEKFGKDYFVDTRGKFAGGVVTTRNRGERVRRFEEPEQPPKRKRITKKKQKEPASEPAR